MSIHRGPGRPRDARLDGRILTATRALLDEGGLPSVTMSAVAAAVGIAKPTLYRRFPNAEALAMAALAAPPLAEAPALEAKDALRRQLHGLVARLAGRAGRSAAQLLATADPESELVRAFRHRVIQAAREEGRDVIARGIAAGACRPGLDAALAIDLLYGPIFLRLLLGQVAMTEAETDALLETAWQGIGNG